VVARAPTLRTSPPPRTKEPRVPAVVATLKSDRLETTLVSALEEGKTQPFFDSVERVSGLPGPRPNLELLAALGARLAAAGADAEPLVEELLASKKLCHFWVGCNVMSARLASGKGSSIHGSAFERLHDLADEVDQQRRGAVIEALTSALVRRGPVLAARLSAYTNGFLHAHVALEALTRREVLDVLGNENEVLARLTEAFDLADDSSRAAERSQGVRVLRAGFPAQITRMAQRFGAVVTWIEEQTTRKRPETRAIVAETIGKLRPVIGEAEAARLRGLLEATAPLPRDPSRIVQGTRKRSRGR
jgi:hypothetical protein